MVTYPLPPMARGEMNLQQLRIRRFHRRISRFDDRRHGKRFDDAQCPGLGDHARRKFSL